jgi:hypothetical protein
MPKYTNQIIFIISTYFNPLTLFYLRRRSNMMCWKIVIERNSNLFHDVHNSPGHNYRREHPINYSNGRWHRPAVPVEQCDARHLIVIENEGSEIKSRTSRYVLNLFYWYITCVDIWLLTSLHMFVKTPCHLSFDAASWFVYIIFSPGSTRVWPGWGWGTSSPR